MSAHGMKRAGGIGSKGAIGKQPSLGMTWLALVFPSVLLFCLFGVLYRIFPYPVYILMLNHAILFVLLLVVLKKAGLSLADIGWKIPGAVGFLLLVGEGVVLGLLLRFVDAHVLVRITDRLLGLFGVLAKPEIGGGGNAPLWALVLATTLFAGVVEESIYRGYALSGFRARLHPVLAILVSSVFFGLFHFGLGLEDMVDSMLFGAILAAVFLWWRSVWPLAIAHTMVNLLALTGH